MGTAVERLIGKKDFFILYFVSLILSSLATAYMQEPGILGAGASGAIFGVMGALLYMSIFRRDMLNYRDAQSIWVLSAMEVLSSFASIGVAVWAHVGGLVAGFLISFLLIPRHEKDIYETHEPHNPYDPHDWMN